MEDGRGYMAEGKVSVMGKYNTEPRGKLQGAWRPGSAVYVLFMLFTLFFLMPFTLFTFRWVLGWCSDPIPKIRRFPTRLCLQLRDIYFLVLALTSGHELYLLCLRGLEGGRFWAVWCVLKEVVLNSSWGGGGAGSTLQGGTYSLRVVFTQLPTAPCHPVPSPPPRPCRSLSGRPGRVWQFAPAIPALGVYSRRIINSRSAWDTLRPSRSQNNPPN